MKETASKILATLLSACAVLLLTAGICFADGDDEKAFEIAWNNMTEKQQYNASMELQAWSVGLSVTEFELFSRVVQAECDGTLEYNDGKLYVAICIWDRVYSSRWSDTVTGVLTASGQFTTVSGGWCSSKYTDASRWAVIKAKEAILKGEVPNNIEYFNCIGYNGNTPYDRIGDNYFMTVGEPTYYKNAVEIKTNDGVIEIREIHRMTIAEELEYLKSKEVEIVDE